MMMILNLESCFAVCFSKIRKILTCKVLPKSNPETEAPQIWLKNTRNITE